MIHVQIQNLLIVELVPQQLILCRVCAELDVSLDHFRQMQHPIESFFCDYGASSYCTKTEEQSETGLQPLYLRMSAFWIFRVAGVLFQNACIRILYKTYILHPNFTDKLKVF